MKGTPQFPQCGFSATVIQILDSLGAKYNTVNVLADPAIRDGVKAYSNWPTIPQLYVAGKFVGGCDIVTEMHAGGELAKLLGADGEVAPPVITITEPAAKALREARGEEGAGDELHVEIDARFTYGLYFGKKEEGEIVVEAAGIPVCLSRASARRADGLSIDFIDGPKGAGFKITSPHEPPKVKQLTPKELKAMMDRGDSFELFDVRTPRERAIAALPNATLLDAEGQEKLTKLPPDTTIVFHCHHGGRSQSAAEHFLSRGFTKVYNLAGGIDAWSQSVDSAVPRY
jgi:monothiol glutaredoxin